MDKTTTRNRINNTSFWKRLKLKLFFSEMSTAKLITQATIAGILISIAVVIERFAMLNAGSFKICFGFFIVLLFPLLLDFRIATISAIISVTLTELVISGDGGFWMQYLPILISFPIIKAFTLFNKKWMFLIGLLVSMSIYIFILSIEAKAVNGASFEMFFVASKTLQMLVAIPIATALFIPMKRVLPTQTDNSWEVEPCCDECEPIVNKEHTCCADNCEDGCKNIDKKDAK